GDRRGRHRRDRPLRLRDVLPPEGQGRRMASAPRPPRREGRRRGEEAGAGSQGRDEAPLAPPAAVAYISLGAVTPRQSSPLCNTTRGASTSDTRGARWAGGSAVRTGRSREDWLRSEATSEGDVAAPCVRLLVAA